MAITKKEQVTPAEVETSPPIGVVVPPPPLREEEEIPELSTLIEDRRSRLELFRYLAQEREVAERESLAKKERAPLTVKIKSILGKFQVGKAMWEGWRINYYATNGSETVTVADMTKAMLAAGLNTDQINGIKAACVKQKKGSATLRIERPKADKESGEGMED